MGSNLRPLAQSARCLIARPLELNISSLSSVQAIIGLFSCYVQGVVGQSVIPRDHANTSPHPLLDKEVLVVFGQQVQLSSTPVFLNSAPKERPRAPPWSNGCVLDHSSLPSCSNLGVGISKECFIFDFARSIQPTVCTKVAVKHQPSLDAVCGSGMACRQLTSLEQQVYLFIVS